MDRFRTRPNRGLLTKRKKSYAKPPLRVRFSFSHSELGVAGKRRRMIPSRNSGLAGKKIEPSSLFVGKAN